MKPHIHPYRRHDRPGKWRCFSTRADGVTFEGTGYSPKDAYRRWKNAAAWCWGRR